MYSVVGSDGQVYGPADMPTLEQWVREGRILPTTNMIDPIDGRVHRAGDLVLMAPLFDRAPPLPAQTAAAPPPRPAPPNVNPQFGQVPVQVNNYINPQPISYPRTYSPGQKSKVAALLLAFFLGCFGVHRFYLGHNGSGLAMLLITILTCGYGAIVTGIWAIVDIILIASDGLTDASGQRLAN